MEKDKGTTKPLSFTDLSTGQIKKILNEEAKSNKAIDHELKQAAAEMHKEVTLLLLGSGEAGKSTFLKQLRVLHDSGFSTEERARYVGIVRRNVVTGMKEVVQHALNAGFDFGTHKSLAKDFATIDDKVEFADVVADIKTLLPTGPVQKILSNVFSYQIPDSTPAFFKDIARIESADFTPTDTDVILSRVRTTSITEYRIQIDNTPFRFIDVAGQRNERRKWIHFFDGVTAMIFVASLSCYNQQMREDPETNMMKDQLTLFDQMINGKLFKDTNVILFLNKRDLFEDKIATVPLDVCFPDYFYGDRENPSAKPDRSKSEHALDYITLQFMKTKKNDKVIYSHVTCATNTDNVSVVFRAVRDSILRSVLD